MMDKIVGRLGKEQKDSECVPYGEVLSTRDFGIKGKEERMQALRVKNRNFWEGVGIGRYYKKFVSSIAFADDRLERPLSSPS